MRNLWKQGNDDTISSRLKQLRSTMLPSEEPTWKRLLFKEEGPLSKEDKKQAKELPNADRFVEAWSVDSNGECTQCLLRKAPVRAPLKPPDTPG